MRVRQARKIARQSAWAQIKCMPWRCTPHRGGSVLEAIDKLQKRGEPVFYIDFPERKTPHRRNPRWRGKI